MILTLLIIVSLMSYSAVVGYVYPTALRAGIGRCRCGRGTPCYKDHEIGAFFQALFWPLGVPWRLGVSLAGRDDTRRAREVSEAEHRLKLAEIAEAEARLVERAYRIAKGEVA